MGGNQSVESFCAMTTPEYHPKPKPPALRPTGVAGLGLTDFLRTAADPTYRPKPRTVPPPRSTGVTDLGMADLIRTAVSPAYRPTPEPALRGGSGSQVVAIDKRFCSAATVTLHLREKFFSLSGDSFTISDVHTGTIWFRVADHAFSIREKKTLLDARSSPVVSMKEKFFAFTPSYFVSSNSGAPLFEIHCKLTLMRTDLGVEFTNQATRQCCKMGLSGDWRHRKATIWLETTAGRTETVGRVFRPLTTARNLILGKQDYYLEVVSKSTWRS